MISLTTRTVTGLYQLRSFEDRFAYLSLQGFVGEATFGYDRYLNQRFYTSRQWRDVRRDVIARDLGCDLGVEGHEIHGGRIVIHHMNPMTVEDVVHDNAANLDPEFLISTTHQTHNAIHYGDARLLPRQLTERRPGDTVPWRK